MKTKRSSISRIALRAAAMLLRHIGRQAEASRLDRALDDTHVTQEMTCAQIGASVEAKL